MRHDIDQRTARVNAVTNPFILKLRHGARLTKADEATLALLAAPARQVERGDIVPEGMVSRSTVLVLEGWACRYKLLENGKRQTTAVYLPGDLCEPFGAFPAAISHTLAAMTPVTLARVPADAIRAAAASSRRIEEALWWDLVVADDVAREHVVSMGRRSATERLGHFFCEVQLRLAATGSAEGPSYPLPLTQTDLADLFGLSAVHVNRSLQELRGSGVISLRNNELTIHDLPGLRALSMFDPAYLQLRQENDD